MYFIVPFIFLFVVIWIIALVAGGVTIAVSEKKVIKESNGNPVKAKNE